MRISPLRTSNSILRACYRLNPISNPLLQISQEVTPTHPSHLTTLHFHTTSPAMAPTTSSRPHAIVISGPSGTGKSTILTRLFAEFPDRFGFSISHTTRQPRAGEQNGREYYFVSVDEFKKLIEENGFVEWAQFGGNFYGTSVRTIEELEKAGRTAVLDIEMEGVKQIASHKNLPLPKPRFLFLAPPSMEELEQRLRSRATDKEEDVLKRLAQARKEMEFAESGDAPHELVVVNDDLETAYQKVRGFFLGEEEGEKK